MEDSEASTLYSPIYHLMSEFKEKKKVGSAMEKSQQCDGKNQQCDGNNQQCDGEKKSTVQWMALELSMGKL